MRTIILLLLFVLSLYANNQKPEWLLNDSDSKGKYFKGISAWYVTDDARMEALSKKDATKNAYNLISEYFGINIKSSFELEEQVKNNKKQTNFQSYLKTKTNKLILNLKPTKVYKEYDKSEENFRLHVLIILDKTSESKINEENQKDRKELEELKRKNSFIYRKEKLLQSKKFFRTSKREKK